jgi:magnesium chelatase subunit D
VSAERNTFWFSAIVGQETLKTALLLNAVDPRVGGVLIRGEKGTAKSTAVRALAAVLPPIRVVDGCRFSCDPDDAEALCDECRARAESGPLPVASRRPRFVELPVSATEDRLIGTLDLEHALKHGERRFEPGLLAAANRGILYVDEVNLLDDHLVDTLLDSAAMGVNIVEREGVAFSHPARFILVGTMNPEEGEVRPQLLDRFGLCVEVEGLASPGDRVEVMERRAAFEDDGVAFRMAWAPQERALESTIASARDRLPRIHAPRDLLFLIANVAADIGVDGHRADLTMSRAASALAALEQRDVPDAEDVRRVAPLVLAHRVRRKPFEEVSFDQMRLDTLMAQAGGEEGEGTSSPEGRTDGSPAEGSAATRLAALGRAVEADSTSAAELTDRLVTPLDRMRRTGEGRRQETRTEDKRGRYTRAEPPRPGQPVDIALDATIREAAAHQGSREGDMAIRIEPGDIRTKVRKRRVGASIVFCVDASGSMGVSTRMEATKAAILELLIDAYQRRDRVGLVSFRGDDAEVLLPPTSSVELAQVKLRSMPSGGATPLAAGIKASLDLLDAETRRDAQVVPWLVLVTDGRANVGIKGGLGSEDARTMASKVRDKGVNAVVIDITEGATGVSVARELARLAGGDYVRLPRVTGEGITGAVRQRLEAV